MTIEDLKLRRALSWCFTLCLAAVLPAGGCNDEEPAGPLAPAPSNRSPVLESVSDTIIAVGDTLRLTARATDPDGDDIRYQAVAVLSLSELLGGTGPDVEFDGDTGAFEFRPREADLPQRTFRFIALDAKDGTDTTSFVVTLF